MKNKISIGIGIAAVMGVMAVAGLPGRGLRGLATGEPQNPTGPSASAESTQGLEEKVQSHLAGKLALTVIEPDGTGFRVRAEFQNPRFEQTPSPTEDMRAVLVKPFYFTVLPSGAMQSFFFAKGTSFDSRVLLKQVVASMQLVTPPSPRAAWRTTEEDVSGEYQALYVLDGSAIKKRKLQYLRARGIGGLLPMPPNSKLDVQSHAKLDVDPSGWLRSVSVNDVFDADLYQTRIVASSTTTAKLAAIESHPELARPMPAAEVDSESVSNALAAAAGKQGADKNLVGGRTYTQIASDLMGRDARSRGQAQMQMAALFRIDPASAAQAKETIMSSATDENAKHRLAGALGAAGTSEAQATLISLLSSKDVMQRQDAAVALGLTKHPTEETAEALHQAMSSPERPVADTAALASGSVVRSMNANPTDPGDTQGAIDALIERLQSATDDQERIVCLQALGNTGDARALVVIQPYLSNPDTSLRAVAAASLRFMAGGTADADVITALGDPGPQVRSAAVSTLPYRAITGVIGAIGAMVRVEKDQNIRLAIVNGLNVQRRETPAVDLVLKWMAENDPSRGVMTLAKQVLAKGQG